jgi:hypothetical protein
VTILWTAILSGGTLATGKEKETTPGQKGTLQGGASVVDTTPQFPVSMVGSFTDRKATSAHDPLHVRSLVLDDGVERVAIAVVDICILPRELCDAAKRRASQATGIREDHMLVAATHTHSAPPTTVLNDIPVDPAYTNLLIGKICEGIELAAKRRAPVKVGWGVGQLPDEVFCRRWFMKEGTIQPNPFGRFDQVRMNPPAGSDDLLRPAGPTDPDVSVVSLRSAAGQPVALLANYSLHYVGDVPQGMLSADYFGEFCRQVESRLGTASGKETPVAILSNGTSGDVNNVDFLKPRKRGEPFTRIPRVAGKVADVALKVHGEIEHRDGLGLAMREREIELAVRKPTPAELEQARAVLATPDDKGLPRLARYYADQAVRLSQYPDTVKLKIQALRVGELGIVGIPCEVFAEIGLEIKRRSVLRPTFVIDLANGYNGYLPSPEQHAVGGYETWAATSSYLDTNASRKIAATAIELLEQVKADGVK